ncbi:hypothetical protein ACH4VR_29355 [Streptomyces sp. NPDC020883]|uniref:hypothetical protein n=1 Tax=Streptomyces sp. NPDC020883 TaxID=3365099 RepID=UPI0037A7BBA4
MTFEDICTVIAAVLHPQLAPVALGGRQKPDTRPPSTAPALDSAAGPSNTASAKAEAHPLNGPGSTSQPSFLPELPDIYADIYATREAEWTRVVSELMEIREWGADPLLHALNDARLQRDMAEENISNLLALGREFSPRPYGFSALARAAGLSEYLVKKGYGAEHIACIQSITGLEPSQQSHKLDSSSAVEAELRSALPTSDAP